MIIIFSEQFMRSMDR